CRGRLVVDPVHGEARWVVEVRAGDGWVPLMTVNPTACAVLTLLEAVRAGLIDPGERVRLGGSEYTVRRLIEMAVRGLVRLFYEGGGNPCCEVEKRAVDRGVLDVGYYYPVKYAFLALLAIREARDLGYLPGDVRSELPVALRRFVLWLRGLEVKPGVFAYNEYVRHADLASTCCGLAALCEVVRLGLKDRDVTEALRRVLGAVMRRYEECKRGGRRYPFYLYLSPESAVYLMMSRFFPDRAEAWQAYGAAHAVAALAAVKRLPEDVRVQVLERRPSGPSKPTKPSRGRRSLPVYPVAALTLALLRRRS
ncbi:MAG: hypothetical protein ABGY09_03630, partial [Euryarchaeota archaeon]